MPEDFSFHLSYGDTGERFSSRIPGVDAASAREAYDAVSDAAAGLTEAEVRQMLADELRCRNIDLMDDTIDILEFSITDANVTISFGGWEELSDPLDPGFSEARLFESLLRQAEQHDPLGSHARRIREHLRERPDLLDELPAMFGVTVGTITQGGSSREFVSAMQIDMGVADEISGKMREIPDNTVTESPLQSRLRRRDRPDPDSYIPEPARRPRPAEVIVDPDLPERIPWFWEPAPLEPRMGTMRRISFDVQLEEEDGTVIVHGLADRIGTLSAADAEAHLPHLRSARAQHKVVAAKATGRITGPASLHVTFHLGCAPCHCPDPEVAEEVPDAFTWARMQSRTSPPHVPGADLYFPERGHQPPPAEVIVDPDLPERMPWMWRLQDKSRADARLSGLHDFSLQIQLEDDNDTVIVRDLSGRHIGTLSAADAEAHLPHLRSARDQNKIVAAKANCVFTGPRSVRVIFQLGCPPWLFREL